MNLRPKETKNMHMFTGSVHVCIDGVCGHLVCKPKHLVDRITLCHRTFDGLQVVWIYITDFYLCRNDVVYDQAISMYHIRLY